MMRLSAFALAGLLVSGMASPASAAIIIGGPFNGVQAGSRDVVEAEGPAPIGEQAELNFVNGVLGTAFTSLTRTTTVDWYNTDTAGVLAFQLVSAPDYFLVGNGSSAVLLRNVDSSSWGVLDLADVLIDLNLGDDMQVAFVSEFTTPPTDPDPVPEPAALMLFAAGFTALGLRRQRRR